MRRLGTLLAAILLIAWTPTLACTSKTPETPVVAPPTVVQGTLEDVDVGEGTVTVDTPQGPPFVYPIGTSTAITIEGKACTLDDLAALEASGEPYNCTVVTDEEGNTVAVNVTKVPEPASVTGTISDVNLEKSTITIKTPEGEKVYEVDPATGIIIGGQSCDLALIQSLVEGGFPTLSCTLIYTLDAKGKAVYVDVVQPPGLVSVEGTIKDVDLVGSTITVKTAQGDKIYDIDPQTGLAIKQNMLAACQRCHPDATTNFPTSWLSHYIPSPSEYPLVYYVNLFYMILIPTVIGGMVIYVGTDIYRRNIYDRRHKGTKTGDESGQAPAGEGKKG